MSSVLQVPNYTHAGAAAKNKQAVLYEVTQLAKLKYNLQRLLPIPIHAQFWPLALADVM